jgi:hypothetical protein
VSLLPVVFYSRTGEHLKMSIVSEWSTMSGWHELWDILIIAGLLIGTAFFAIWADATLQATEKRSRWLGVFCWAGALAILSGNILGIAFTRPSNVLWILVWFLGVICLVVAGIGLWRQRIWGIVFWVPVASLCTAYYIIVSLAIDKMDALFVIILATVAGILFSDAQKLWKRWQ